MDASNKSYSCEIRWTTKGVPHIKAKNMGDLGFGQGYACSKHHIATLMDQIVKVRGERSFYFGPGENDANIISDAGYKYLGLREVAQDGFDTIPQKGQDFVKGFAAGINYFLKNAKPEDFPAWVRNEEWLKPISEYDLVAFYSDIALAASSRNLIPFMAIAAPPGPDGPAPTPPLSSLPGGALASNGWAIGGDLSSNGRGMVVGNPHFPWYGENRFWECHLTIPGEIDVYGATLVGAPGILIGFNANVAWTHTFSVGKRFTIYKLRLNEEDPTSYYYGDHLVQMDCHRITVKVKRDEMVEEVTKEVWSSQYGPILNLPLLGWTNEFALSSRDANIGNLAFIPQFMEMDAASSMEEFKRAHENENGMPWANTIAADKEGKTWYIDSSRTPNLSESGKKWLLDKIENDPFTKLLLDNRIAMLDGSSPDCDWADDPNSPAPGLVPFSSLPQLSRDDFVTNSNDSPWLTNPKELIEDFSPMQGLIEAPTPRTRACLATLQRGGTGEGGRITKDDLIKKALSNKSETGALIIDQLVRRLEEFGEAGEPEFLEISKILRNWDLHFNLDSKGAILFREFLAGFDLASLKDAGALYQDSFDVNSSFNTPCQLVSLENSSHIKNAVINAVKALESAGLPLDASPGVAQFALISGEKIPVHGAHETDGATNILSPVNELPNSSREKREDLLGVGEHIPGRTEKTGLTTGGYSVSCGTSFLYVLSFEESGPNAHGVLVYGQSEDLASPHHKDQIQDYVNKELRPLLFSEKDILSCSDLWIEEVVSD